MGKARTAVVVFLIALSTMGASSKCGGATAPLPSHQSGQRCYQNQLGKKAIDDHGRELVCRKEPKFGPAGQWWLLPREG